MKCQKLAAQIERSQPEASTSDVARLCLLLANEVDDLAQLQDEHRLEAASREMEMRMQAATDQHAAMTVELEELAESDPQKFHPEQIWILIRAIKVQSQILEMFLGQPALDV
jgi:hypothetical protein